MFTRHWVSPLVIVIPLIVVPTVHHREVSLAKPYDHSAAMSIKIQRNNLKATDTSTAIPNITLRIVMHCSGQRPE
ncbi:hypothetical protein DFJ58DRAFT_776139 [Suillus subalutaceus]|uniref:uncharacterized protein n=1 Tax=Suillus subalutaceus TaxID=48586 RepID=UPI001B85EA46|nr:uncharacterized protein DFJ58DRAFT_776139 [Suillus subalutaceus]KAG1862043.1 hypothetical protein DFJ58DRAFT_776139 [Suillus subalutaceus]